MRRTEHRRGGIGWVALLASLSPACGDPARAPGALAAAPPSSSATVRTDACSEGEHACSDETTRWICRGGTRVEEKCVPDETCIAHGCVDPRSTHVGREALRGFGTDGFLNGWSAVTPLAKKSIDAYLEARDPETVGGARAFHATCAPDGFVTPRPRPVEKKDGQVSSLAAGVLLNDEARKLRLWASTSGKLRVMLGGVQAASIDETPGIDGRPLVDERSFDVDLPKGATDITVILEAPSDGARVGGFYLRLRELDGRPVEGVLFAERHEACSPSSLVDPRGDVGLDGAGLFLHLDPVFRGLAPRGLAPWPIAVDVVGSRKTVTHADASSPGDVRLVPPERGGFEVKASLAGEPFLTRTMPGYGELVPRIARVIAAASRAGSAPIPRGSADSLEHHVATLARLVSKGDADLPFIERQTKTAERLVERLERGEDPYARETGVVHRAYRSSLDGHLQPYVAFVPKSQSHGKPQPMVLVYHGRNRLPEHALRTLIGEAPDDHMTLRFAERNLPTFPDQGAVLVAPWGYDEGGPHPLGEDDLLRVISEMSAAYAIDPRRVSLTGYSLGGTVAFVAPLHHPDVFSAAAPLCGYPNLLAYSSVAGVPHAPWEDALLARKYIVNWAENGAYLPLHVVHGGLDVPGRSKVVVDRYKALGFPVDFDVQDDLDHDVWDYAYEDGKMVAWLAGRSRPKAPKRVRFVTGEYRYDRAYWLRVIGLRDSAAGELGSVDATFDEKAREVTVKTSALTAFAIDRAALGAAAKDEPLSIVVDGEPLSATAGSDTAFLVRSDRWSVSADEPSRAGMKRHGVSGPLDDVLRHRVIVVYGTKSRAHATANRLVAEHFARAGGLAEVSYPILADTEATGDAVKGASLVLVGSPEDNAVTAAYAATLPIRFESGGIVVRGERYEGPGVGVSFIAPRPDDPGEYVVVHAGVDERGLLASRFLPRYLPDYVVYDARAAAQRGGLLMDQRPYLAGGSFGEDWK